MKDAIFFLFAGFLFGVSASVFVISEEISNEYKGAAITEAYEACKDNGGILRANITVGGDYLYAVCGDLSKVYAKK